MGIPEFGASEQSPLGFRVQECLALVVEIRASGVYLHLTKACFFLAGFL